MEGLDGMVVEGNSPADFINPHLIIFIIGPDGQIKESAKKMITLADIIVMNSGEKPDDPNSIIPEILSGTKKKKEIFLIDLFNLEGEIDKFTACVEKKLSEKLN